MTIRSSTLLSFSVNNGGGPQQNLPPVMHLIGPWPLAKRILPSPGTASATRMPGRCVLGAQVMLRLLTDSSPNKVKCVGLETGSRPCHLTTASVLSVGLLPPHISEYFGKNAVLLGTNASL